MGNDADLTRLAEQNKALKEMLGLAISELVATCATCECTAERKRCSEDCVWAHLKEAESLIKAEA